MRANTQWFRDARWGVFIHYLAGLPSADDPTGTTPESWNRRIDGFDVDRLAAQLSEVRAGYLFITLGQNSGYFLSPNATYDRIVGTDDSRLSRRDLVADLIAALRPYDIPLLVYLPSHAPTLDRRAVERLGCTPTWDASAWQLRPGSYTVAPGTDERLSAFQHNWEAIIAEWSNRWGKGVRGWWFDGCYFADVMYQYNDAPNFRSFAAAAKSGNPDSLVAFNTGVKVPIVSATEHNDYTPGEVANALPVSMNSRYGRPATAGAKYWGMPLGDVDGAQLHLLSFLGPYWCRGTPRFSDALVAGYTQHINDCGGVMSWDVPTADDGLIPDEYLAQLRAIRDAAPASTRSATAD